MAARLIIVAALVAAVAGYLKGCADGKASAADTIARIQIENTRLLAETAGMANALAEVNREAERRIAEAERQAELAAAAAAAAERAEDDLRRRAAAFERELAQARQRPGCDALLAADLEAVCGI